MQTLPGGCAHSWSLGTLPWLVSQVSAPSEMRYRSSLVDGLTPHSLGILPGRWMHSWLLGTLPQLVPVVSAPSKMRCTQSPDGWQGEEETGAVAAGEFLKVSQRVFFFLGKILLLTPVAPSVQGRAWPLTQPTSPAWPGAVRVRISPAQLSTLLSQRPWSPGFTTSSLFPSL